MAEELEDADAKDARAGVEVRRELGIMTPQELADALGVHVGTLKQWRYRKVGPNYTVAERRVYYRYVDVDTYFALNTVSLHRQRTIEATGVAGRLVPNG